MPYINEKRREALSDILDEVRYSFCSDEDIDKGEKGDINYLVCMIVVKYLLARGELNYQTISEAIDAVHDAECELRRRLLEVYEDKKIRENGDIFQDIITEILKKEKK